MAASNEHETTVFSVKVPTLVKVEDDWGNNHNAPVPIDRGDGDGVTIEEIEEIGALGEIVEPRNDTKVKWRNNYFIDPCQFCGDLLSKLHIVYLMSPMKGHN